MLDNMLFMQDLTDQEKMMFQSEMLNVQKNSTTAVLLALFLGGFGAHHFYFGKIGLGVVYVLFCITGIPAIIAFVECFFQSGRTNKFNTELAQQIAMKIKAMRSTSTPAPAPSMPAAS